MQMRDRLTAIHLMCSSKKGVSANQSHRSLGVTIKTGGSVGHRIREAMREGGLAPMGGDGGIVESTRPMAGRKAQRSSVVRSTRMQSLLLWSAAVRLARSTLIARPKMPFSHRSKRTSTARCSHD